ncbi:MAG: SDR family oxidoreductase [Muribaculaceae bacterium]|nr:SDR family oxidoreductase [Muribaculaceae bacterium]
MSDNKGVFITGAASGIGLAAARLFAERGWSVAAADIDGALLRERLHGQPGIAATLQCDIADSAAVEAAMAAAEAATGGLGAVVANAGIHIRNSVCGITDAELDRLTDINIKGSVYTLRAAARLLVAARRGGAVVLTASDQAFIGKPGNFGYGLTKGAIAQMTRTAALELAPHGVRVNAVCPGTVDTAMVDKIFENASAAGGGSVEAMWAEERALFPLGRTGTPREVAQAIYFLAAEATFSTGALLKTDGGLTAG